MLLYVTITLITMNDGHIAGSVQDCARMAHKKTALSPTRGAQCKTVPSPSRRAMCKTALSDIRKAQCKTVLKAILGNSCHIYKLVYVMCILSHKIINISQ